MNRMEFETRHLKHYVRVVLFNGESLTGYLFRGEPCGHFSVSDYGRSPWFIINNGYYHIETTLFIKDKQNYIKYAFPIAVNNTCFRKSHIKSIVNIEDDGRSQLIVSENDIKLNYKEGSN